METPPPKPGVFPREEEPPPSRWCWSGNGAGCDGAMWDSSVPRASCQPHTLQTGVAGGRQSLKPSPSTAPAALCCPGWALAPHLVFREGAQSSPAVCPSLLPHSGCVPDVPGLKANAGATGCALRCWWHPDSSLSYPPAPLNPFHPLPRGAAEAQEGLGATPG